MISIMFMFLSNSVRQRLAAYCFKLRFATLRTPSENNLIGGYTKINLSRIASKRRPRQVPIVYCPDIGV